jgi:hypothetical protein
MFDVDLEICGDPGQVQAEGAAHLRQSAVCLSPIIVALIRVQHYIQMILAKLFRNLRQAERIRAQQARPTRLCISPNSKRNRGLHPHAVTKVDSPPQCVRQPIKVTFPSADKHYMRGPCPTCASTHLARKPRRGIFDKIPVRLGFWPYQCQECAKCFYLHQRHVWRDRSTSSRSKLRSCQ